MLATTLNTSEANTRDMNFFNDTARRITPEISTYVPRVLSRIMKSKSLDTIRIYHYHTIPQQVNVPGPDHNFLRIVHKCGHCKLLSLERSCVVPERIETVPAEYEIVYNCKISPAGEGHTALESAIIIERV